MINSTLNAEKQLLSLIKKLKQDGKKLSQNEVLDVLKKLISISESESATKAIVNLLEELNTHQITIGHKLTLREQEVFSLIGLGEQSSSIATYLNLSKTTVETHRKNIRRKLKLKDRRQLLYLAIIFGLTK